MKFAEVLDALMEGKPISRKEWAGQYVKYLYFEKDMNCFAYHVGEDSEYISYTLDLTPDAVIADDWDIDIWDAEDSKVDVE